MTGNIKRTTPNYGFRIPYFDRTGWGREMERNFDVADAALFASTGLGGIVGTWTNSTEYDVADRVVDPTDGTIWGCNVDHVSAGTGSFANDRAAHPTYWTAVTSSFAQRMLWTTGTTYNVNDIMYYGYKWAIARRRFVSSASFETDLANNDLVLMFDGTPTVNAAVAAKDAAEDAQDAAELAQTQAQNAATGASASASAAATSASQALAFRNTAETHKNDAATSATNAANSASAAAGSATTAGTQATNAATSASQAAISEANAATSETNAAISAATALASANTFKGMIFGLTLANNSVDPTNDIDIAIGSTIDNVSNVPINIGTNITRQLDVAFGTGNGGRFDASISDGTWYAFAISNGTTSNVGLSKSLNPTGQPNYPSGYTNYRRIGAVLRRSGAIALFKQHDDHFNLVTAITERNSTAAFAQALFTLSVPTGIIVQPKLNSIQQQGTIGNIQTQFGNADNLSGSLFSFVVTSVAQEIDVGNILGGIYTDTLGRITYAVVILGGTLNQNTLNLTGWIDHRDRY